VASAGAAVCGLVSAGMAADVSGVRAADRAASVHLAYLGAGSGATCLERGGHLIVKMFQGEGVDEWLTEQRLHFSKCQLVKPKASRSDSREVFAVCHAYSA